MRTGTSDQLRFGRVGWAVLAVLALLSVLTGVWSLTGLLTTYLPALAVPAAAGLPFLMPPLRVAPLADGTWTFWAIDLAGALVMLLAAAVLLHAAWRRRPEPGPLRAFGRGVAVTVLAVLVGNLVRGVLTSFVVQADLTSYLGFVLANTLVSVLLGAVLGLLVGAVAAVVAARSPRDAGAVTVDG